LALANEIMEKFRLFKGLVSAGLEALHTLPRRFGTLPPSLQEQYLEKNLPTTPKSSKKGGPRIGLDNAVKRVEAAKGAINKLKRS
jgi:hypothetical protein